MLCWFLPYNNVNQSKIHIHPVPSTPLSSCLHPTTLGLHCAMLNRSLCLTLCEPMDCSPPGDSPGKNTGVGCHALLQGFFPTQESNPGLSCCKQILYHLSHQGSPRILEWVVYPFSSRSSRPRNQTGVACNCRWILYQLSYWGALLYSNFPAALFYIWSYRCVYFNVTLSVCPTFCFP